MSANDNDQGRANQGVRELRPTILLGVGGTGKGVLMGLRQRFFAKHGRTGLPIMAYRLLDTSKAVELAGNAAIRENDYALRSLWFTPSEFLSVDLDGNTVQTALQQKMQWPQVDAWAHPGMVNFAQQITSGTGAGQMRPFGRLGFYLAYQKLGKRAGLRADFESIIRQITSNDAKQQTEAMTGTRFMVQQNQIEVVIVTSLAGGTGSGMFLDAAFFAKSLPKILSMPHLQVQVTGYLVMPSVYVSACPDLKDKLYANGYGALKELEHFMSSDPDTTEHREFTCWWEPQTKLVTPGPAFHQCWIVDNSNEYVQTVNDPQDVCSMIADHLYLTFQDSQLYSKIIDGRINVKADVLGSGYENRVPPEGKPCLYSWTFEHHYWSFGVGKIFVDLGRVTNGATSLACEAAVDALVAPDRSEPVTRDAAVKSVRPFLDAELANRLLKVPVGGVATHPITHVDRIDREFAALKDTLSGWGPERTDRGKAIEAKVREIVDDYANGSSRRHIETVNVPEAQRDAVRAAVGQVSVALFGDEKGVGCVRASANACQAISKEMDAAKARYSRVPKPSGETYRRALEHLTAAEHLPFRKVFATRTVLSWAVAEAAKITKAAVEAAVQHDLCPRVADSVIEALGLAASGEGLGAATLARQLEGLGDALQRAQTEFRARTAAFVPERAPPHTPRVVEVPYQGLPWEQVRGAILSSLEKRSVARTARKPGHELLSRYFSKLNDRKKRPSQLEELIAESGVFVDQVWSHGLALVRDLEVGGDVDAAMTFQRWKSDAGARAELLEKVMRHSFPWWKSSNAGLPIPPRLISQGRYSLTENLSLDAEIDQVGKRNFEHFTATSNAKDKAPHAREEVLFTSEQSGVPLLCVEEIEMYRAAYERAWRNDSTGNDFANRHIDRSFLDTLADIRAVSQERALKHFETLRRVLMGMMTGAIWREAGKLWLRIYPADAFTPPYNKDMGTAYRHVVRIVMAHDVASASLKRAIDEWVRGAQPRDVARLRALAGITYNEVFPESDRPGGHPERDAVFAILQEIDDGYMRMKQIRKDDEAFRAWYESDLDAIAKGRLATEVVDEWRTPSRKKRLRTLRVTEDLGPPPADRPSSSRTQDIL